MPKLFIVGKVMATNAHAALAKAREKYRKCGVYKVKLSVKEFRGRLNLYKVYAFRKVR